MDKPITQYHTFQQAYDYFNSALFDSALPACMITLQREKGAGGYFWQEKFVHRKTNEKTDELALNPDYFHQHDDAFILSILVHEMAHLWQAHFGKPSRGGYHNKEWAAKMLTLGLKPISHDNPGKMIGQKVAHEIVLAGAFDKAATQLLSSGFTLAWQSKPVMSQKEQEVKEQKKRSKSAYICPGCGAKAWGKPGLSLVCGDCQQVMESEEE